MNKGNAVERLHNLCDAIEKDRDGSEFSREEWERIDAENLQLRKLFKAITEAINSARPEEGTEDMDAIIPAGVWRQVVDTHARVLYERNHAASKPSDSKSNLGTAQVKQE